ASTLLGHILLDRGDPQLALNCFTGVAARISNQRVLMDWIWEMPLRLGLASACLNQRNYTSAVQHAQKALATSQRPPEKTYMTLALATLAEIACAEGNLSLANKHSLIALGLAEAGGIPLAAEYAYRVAAKICQSRKEMKAMTDYQDRASAVRS